jgi:hypothetical protein
LAQGGAVYRSVRSACGHVARHLPNLWKMGKYYLEGRFDPRNYGASDKGKEELQAHPHKEDKEKVFIFFFYFYYFYYFIIIIFYF